jgi:soluble lytic murein transglycosylase-like protein
LGGSTLLLACSLAWGAHAWDCLDEQGRWFRTGRPTEGVLIRVQCRQVDDIEQQSPKDEPRPFISIAWPMPVRVDRRMPVLPSLDARTPAQTRRTVVDPLIEQASRRFGHDPHLLRAIIQTESAFNAGARSPAGAIGLMQVMPATGLRYGFDIASLYDPASNLAAGSRYLADLQRMFPERLDLALAAYNAGESAVVKHQYRIPPYAETQQYVRLVLDAYARFREAARAPAAAPASD